MKGEYNMIYTLTLNPALDYAVSVPNFKTGGVNRAQSEKILPGGKGINVSVVLHNLGVESVALGFIAGFTGEEIKRLAEELGCKTDFIRVKNGLSRINVKMKAQVESEINGQGPVLQEEDIEALFKQLDTLQEGDTILFAGSISKGMSSNIYAKMCEHLAGRGVRLVVDTTGQQLLSTLVYKPFLIKPNHIELEEIMGYKLSGQEDLLKGARKLQKMGAKNVLVSMAGDGALLLTENGDVYRMKAPKGEVVNSVGAGDSMVAGFLAGYEITGDYEKALELGIATGSASAFSADLATKEEVDALLENMRKS